ncbi:MAG TPA: peptidoglycan-binding domain-containing protein, partial [Kofleriaceae bacterium]|nr:peptidoglycan-binding domain-containing protein [Kofleriaceae bacterium]
VPVAPPRAGSHEACAEPVSVSEQGRLQPPACTVPATATIVDLRDAWTPVLFAVQPDGTAPDFRPSYLALAREQDLDGKPLPPNIGLAELYGVVPSFAIVRARFTQSARYACHGNVDAAPLAKLARPYGEELAGLVKFSNHQRELLGVVLERVRVQRGLADYTALATDRELGDTYTRWKAADELYTGIVAAQKILQCEGLLGDKSVDGTYSWAFGQAVEQFQRRNFLIPNGRLDPDTRTALATDPRELDFRFALRVLRERVVDATGLIEDGTAGAGEQPVLGRMLDPLAMRTVHGHDKPLAHAAPDLIDAATEAAAKQLGWIDPAATAAFLASHPGGLRVALALPARPAYHAAHMELSAEIDRGDVWYDEQPVPRVAWRRPALILYAQDGATKRALVRWPTTIGGWADVRIDGAITHRWKESEVGPREWRQLYAAPTWLPPDTTPDDELVRWVAKGKWELKKSIMGPGPLSAFGLIRLPHERAVRMKNGSVQYVDNGIGTHGSAVVTSLLNGTSHGCHRLYNHMALRLGGFLLDHRNHVVKGQQPEHFRRTIDVGGTFHAQIDTRGFMYELTPPVHIDVLSGTIRSTRKVPPADAAPAGAD